MIGMLIPKRNGGRKPVLDVVVVGSGPNGLAAAILLAREGYAVRVIEAAESIGGGARSAELTLPGFVHDVCSAIHPLGVSSPFLRVLPLADHGLEWVHPAAPLAHPLEDGTAAMLERTIGATSATLGEDGQAYRALMEPMVDGWEDIAEDVLGPLGVPRRPFAMARFGRHALRSSRGLTSRYFTGPRAAALFAGLAAHAMLPLERAPTGGVAIVLAILGHTAGWPFPRGGTQKLADSMASYLRFLGGEIVTGCRVGSLDDVPRARAVLLDVTPKQLLAIAGDRLPGRYRRRLERYRYGPGAFKLDWALDGPIPWTAAGCERAGTLHIGGSAEEIAAAERAVSRGQSPERPFVLVAQQSLFDASRAPSGQHTAWAYCHVPPASAFDMTERIEAQIERFAPGFRDRILARHVMDPRRLEAYNENYVGGDINGGAQDLGQLFARPAPRLDPYAVPIDGVYLCSSSTPPGGGVHGMCGYHAARSALRKSFGAR